MIAVGDVAQSAFLRKKTKLLALAGSITGVHHRRAEIDQSGLTTGVIASAASQNCKSNIPRNHMHGERVMM